MNPKDKKEDERPASYPKPAKADTQLQNQPEYIDEEPNTFKKEISNIEENRKEAGDEQT